MRSEFDLKFLATAVASLLTAILPLSAQDTFWRCTEPAHPMRFVTSEDMKDEPPPCEEWVQLRGINLAALLEDLASEPHQAANLFLAQSSRLGGPDYPVVESGMPVMTSSLYDAPEQYGFETLPLSEAPTGSLVVYNGLGGILVESRETDAEEWAKQVLYPSKAAGFLLTISDLEIPGKMQPKVVVPIGRSD